MIRHIISVPAEHRVYFTRNVFTQSNPLLTDILSQDHDGSIPRILILIDSGVSTALPSLIPTLHAHAHSHQTTYSLAGIGVRPGGEACKNNPSALHHIWELIESHRLDRHSQIWSIGGGAFLDMTGFAASTAHRGIRHIRFPTTTLSQGDGGVGVKNSVNYFGKKNWIGTFSIPHAVINDFTFLTILPDREKRAGLIESVKVALIRDADFFENLVARSDALAQLDPLAIEFAIKRSAELHSDHIANSGDPFERGSTRPLDFGHWAAHKLEQMTNFRLNHGEAVAIGMALDLHYAALTGILAQSDANRALNLIAKLGFALFDDVLLQTNDDGQPLILDGLEEFREHLGGKLTITMVTAIGQKMEINQMNPSHLLAALKNLIPANAAIGH